MVVKFTRTIPGGYLRIRGKSVASAKGQHTEFTIGLDDVKIHFFSAKGFSPIRTAVPVQPAVQQKTTPAPHPPAYSNRPAHNGPVCHGIRQDPVR